MATYTFDTFVTIGTHPGSAGSSETITEAYQTQVNFVTTDYSTSFSYEIESFFNDETAEASIDGLGELLYVTGGLGDFGVIRIVGTDYLETEVFTITWGTDSSATLLGVYLDDYNSSTGLYDTFSTFLVLQGDDLPSINDPDAFTDFVDSLTGIGYNPDPGAEAGDIIEVNTVSSGSITKSKNLLNGSNDSEKIIGSAGKDVINGANGADTLNGKAGKDVLKGGKGKDILDGGKGKDTLIGGDHADTFVFAKKYGKDTIKDFTDNVDTIQLDDALWGGGLNKKKILNKFAEVDGDDIVLDFGNHELRIQDFTDIDALRNDLDIV
ncbi:MAG: hypothetical protein ABJO27_25740 [Pseudoruegeria sp.]